MSTPSTTQPEPAEITRQRLSADERTRLEQFRDACQAALDGKPWEYRLHTSNEWQTPRAHNVPPGYYYARPKPFVLGRTVNGFTLPAGREWHRWDWEEADLEGGWRPAMLYETETKEDQEFVDGKWTAGSFVGKLWSSANKVRTRRPIITAPEVRAWTFEEAPERLKLICKSSAEKCIGSLYTDGFYVYSGLREDGEEVSFTTLLRDFVQLNGQPCGVEVGK